MKARTAQAFTIIELIIVCGTVGALILLVGGYMNNTRARHQRLNCASQLKSIGFGLRMWANDHEENFPWEVSASKGGTRESVESPDVWRHFQAVSNEITTPMILACAADRERARATNWTRLGNSNISYFLSLETNSPMPSRLLAGDRFISTNNQVFSGLLVTTNWQLLRMLPRRHGNVAGSDGSVMQLSTAGLREAFSNRTVRLGLP
jgi:hypothetical protein